MIRFRGALREHRWPGSMALFAIVWMIVRAAVQSITIDEADTYLVWVARPSPLHWEPGSNNHILNSLLIRLVTSCFGVSHLVVRIPALIGGVLYVAIAYWFSWKLIPAGIVRWGFLVCLIFNPFLFDYFVAARGYSLATALLVAAIAISIRMRLGDHSPDALMRRCALASVCLGLSFAANFSFAFVCAATWAALLTCAWLSRPGDKGGRWRGTTEIVAAAILPGAGVAVFLCGWALWKWNRGELFYGAHSLSEALRSVTDAMLYRPNPDLINPLLLGVVEQIKGLLLPLTVLLFLAHVCVLVVQGAGGRSRWERRLLEAAALLAAILVVTVAAHWLAFRVGGLLLPLARTALYVVPLCTLLAGVALSLPARHDVFRRGLAACVVILAGYFLLCLRLHTFKEWYWDGEVQQAYRLTAHYARTHGVDRIFANWKYASGLEFYRRASRNYDLSTVISATKDYPVGMRLYVLDPRDDQEFIRAQRLQKLYEDELSDIVIAAAVTSGSDGN